MRLTHSEWHLVWPLHEVTYPSAICSRTVYVWPSMAILSLAQTQPMVRSAEITSKSDEGLRDEEDIVSTALWPLALVAATAKKSVCKIKAKSTCVVLTPEKNYR